MKEEVQELLENFSSEAGSALIATGIVNLDGGLEAYVAHEIQGKDYNVQRSATIFAMIVNILNKTLDEVYLKQEFVNEILVSAANTYFLVNMVIEEKYFHGITFSSAANIDNIRSLMNKYKPLFAEELK